MLWATDLEIPCGIYDDKLRLAPLHRMLGLSNGGSRLVLGYRTEDRIIPRSGPDQVPGLKADNQVGISGYRCLEHNCSLVR